MSGSFEGESFVKMRSNTDSEEDASFTLIKPTYPAPLSKLDTTKQTRLSFSTSDRATKRVIAPYVRVVRRGQPQKPDKEEEESKQFRFYLQKKPSVLTRNLSAFLSDTVDLCSIITESADVLKGVCKASGVNLYMTDAAAGVICQNSRIPASDKYQVNWKIEPGHTIAAFVAYQKEYVMVDDVLGDIRFPEGVGYKDETIKSVLCVPIVSPDDNCIAVIELYRDVTQPVFGRDDLKIAVVVTGWMGAAIHQNQQRVELQKQTELHYYMMNIVKCYFCGEASQEDVITEIVNFARSMLVAERGSFYAIEPKSDSLEGKAYEYGIDGIGAERLYKKHLKVKFNQDSGIPGIVARECEPINIIDTYQDARFNKEHDEKLGFISRSILSYPIMGPNKILGVIQLVNKIKGNGFSTADENVLKTIASYCSVVIEFGRLKHEFLTTERINQCYLEMLHYHMQPCRHDISYIEASNRMEGIPENFDEFSWYIPNDYMGLMPRLTLYCFSAILKHSEINYTNMMHFVLAVKKSYRENPYHSFLHAFNVHHCIYNIIKRNEHVFDPIETKAFLVAALCHDLDHRGFTNNFLQLASNPLVELYEESYLENHHYFVTMLLLKNYEIFPAMSPTAFETLSKEIKHCILSTDLAQYFRVRTKLMHVHYEETLDWNNSIHRNLVKSIMMTASDLSGQCKPYHVSKKITDALYREFYNQGDIEKTFGLCPLSMMDRDKVNLIPEDQVQFLSVVVIPCTELLELVFPNTEDLKKGAKTLRDTWRRIIELRGQKLWRQEESVVSLE